MTDFGLAKDSQASNLTRPGQALGSLDYMAPGADPRRGCQRGDRRLRARLHDPRVPHGHAAVRRAPEHARALRAPAGGAAGPLRRSAGHHRRRSRRRSTGRWRRRRRTARQRRRLHRVDRPRRRALDRAAAFDRTCVGVVRRRLGVEHRAGVVDARVGLVGDVDAVPLSSVASVVGEVREARSCRPRPARSAPGRGSSAPPGRRRVERGDDRRRRRRPARNRSAGARPPKESGSAEVAEAALVELRVERLRAVARAGSATFSDGLATSMPRTIIAARPLRPLGVVSARSSAPCSPRWLAGANASVPRSFSSGVHLLRQRRRRTARRGRPASGRRSRRCLPMPVVELARGADHVEHAAALGDADQVRVRRPACRGLRSPCARPRSRPSASG